MCTHLIYLVNVRRCIIYLFSVDDDVGRMLTLNEEDCSAVDNEEEEYALERSEEEDELPRMDHAIRNLARFSSGDSNLPSTNSLPDFTAKEPSTTTVKKPREKLTTVLRQGDRLIRSCLHPKEQTAQPNGIRKLDRFIHSLVEDKKKKDLVRAVLEGRDSTSSAGRLSRLVPADILKKRPRLSTDNAPGDAFEIILDEEGDKHANRTSNKSLQLVRKSIAPKIKKASITKLNEQLDERIKLQAQMVQREREKKIEMDTTAVQPDSDEFGVSDADVIDEENNVDDCELDFKVKILNRKINGTRRRAIIDDSHDDEEDDNEDHLENLVDHGDDSERSTVDGSDNEDESLDNTDDKVNNIDNDDAEDADDGRLKFSRGAFNLIDEEAEDEDSEVSVDDIDEEAISKELKESAFITSGSDAEDEQDAANQLAIHRQIRDAEDEEDMEMFMNRFIPDEALRELGAFAEMRKKYSAVEDDKDHPRLCSTFGNLKGLEIDTAYQSHPDFLKLLDQDRLSSETEPETETSASAIEEDDYNDEEATGYLGEDDGTNLIENLIKDDSCRINSTVISSYPPVRRPQFSMDANLKDRLFAAGALKEDGPIESKKGRTTFETISSRPVINKEKTGKR